MEQNIDWFIQACNNIKDVPPPKNRYVETIDGVEIDSKYNPAHIILAYSVVSLYQQYERTQNITVVAPRNEIFEEN